MLARAKFRRYASIEDARAFADAIARLGSVVDDPPPSPGVTPDPGDDYLVALGRHIGADAIVSGDRHLLELPEARPPVLTPRAFLDQLTDT